MTEQRPQSLRRRLFWRLLVVQSVVLILVIAVLFGSGQLFDFRSTENTVEILEAGIGRDPQGGLILKDTDAIRALRKDVPDLWYIIRDGQGHQLTEGDIPEEYAGIGNALDRIGQARFGWNIGDRERPTARMRWVETDAGRVQILTGSSALAPFFMVFLGISLILLKLVVPILGIIALGAFVATPIVVRRSLRGLEQAAAQADSIDIEKRGVRLTSTGMPSEVTPFVRAVNGALGRLDEGYDRQERFLADAAHELRTPIAILKTRVASLPQGMTKSLLTEDTARLAVLAEQMLDLQRLKQDVRHFTDVDLIQLAQRVVLDMGPLAFTAGYEVGFEAAAANAVVQGDPVALERVVTNLVQNAIDHGGRTGTIAVIVGQNWIEVADEGQGVPAELRERVFEPFFKRHQGTKGSGLGLKLVQEIMELHGGNITIVQRPLGACFRVEFAPSITASGQPAE